MTSTAPARTAPIRTATVHDRYGDDDIAEYYRSGFWRPDTLVDLLAEQVAQRPDKKFVFDSTTELTFSQLHEQALRVAAGLRRLGVVAGDRISVQLPNWTEFVVLAVAVNAVGGVIVPIMPIYRDDEVGYVLRHSGAKVAVTCQEFRTFDYGAMYDGLRGDCPELQNVVLVRAADHADIGRAQRFTDLAVSGPPAEVAASLGPAGLPDDPYMIVYTSGTTARPKGCLHTLNTLVASASAIGLSLAYSENDVQFGPSPVTHSTGVVTSMFLPLIHGASTYLMEAWEPKEGLARIEKYGCTVSVTATAFLQMMMAVYDPAVHDASSMRFWVCAGSPIPGSVVEHATEMLSGGHVLSLYGRSENMLTTMCTATDPPERSATSDGRALRGASVQIVDPDGTELPRGSEGDIAYRGPSHILEYYGDPEQTAALFTPAGYSRSGDLGVMDADGFVRVTGRLKDIIIRGGLNISARELEDILATHPGVGAVAVVGMPDVRLGERVCVYVVPKPGQDAPTLEGLIAMMKERRMSVTKLPERLEIVDTLPMTMTGKVQKHVLRADVARKIGAAGAAGPAGPAAEVMP